MGGELAGRSDVFLGQRDGSERGKFLTGNRPRPQQMEDAILGKNERRLETVLALSRIRGSAESAAQSGENMRRLGRADLPKWIRTGCRQRSAIRLQDGSKNRMRRHAHGDKRAPRR